MDNQDKLKEYIEKVPQDIKDILYSLDYPKLLEEIVGKNKLMIDQAGLLEIETTLVMAGLVPLNDYKINLIKSLEITEEKAAKIAKDIDSLIFKNIRKSLEEINNEDSEADYVIEQRAKTELSKENILYGIEDPKITKETDDSVSFSSLESNNNTTEKSESFSKGVEIKKENSLEIKPSAILPPQIYQKKETPKNFSENISPITNIVETKKETDVISQRETVIIEEKTKLPEKKPDQYREPII